MKWHKLIYTALIFTFIFAVLCWNKQMNKKSFPAVRWHLMVFLFSANLVEKVNKNRENDADSDQNNFTLLQLSNDEALI